MLNFAIKILLLASLELCICSCLAIYGVSAKTDAVETNVAKMELAVAGLIAFAIAALLTYLLVVQCSLKLAILSEEKKAKAGKIDFTIQS